MDKLNRLILFSGLALTGLLLLASCRDKEEPEIIPPSEFNKTYREQLGDNIQIAIAFQEDHYPVLPNIPPFDTTVYAFVQTLYNQVTFAMKIDHQSPANDRWNADRKWRVTILKSMDKNAFVIPGGHIYLTTGLLKSLQSDHELYYILAFEASLMNERFLLQNLISNYNTNILASVADGTPAPGGVTSRTLADVMAHLTFEEEVVKEVDEFTAELICNTSVMRRTGILRLLDVFEEDWIWLNTRTTYSSRDRFVETELNDRLGECGNFVTEGAYQRLVLNWLE